MSNLKVDLQEALAGSQAAGSSSELAELQAKYDELSNTKTELEKICEESITEADKLREQVEKLEAQRAEGVEV